MLVKRGSFLLDYLLQNGFPNSLFRPRIPHRVKVKQHMLLNQKSCSATCFSVSNVIHKMLNYIQMSGKHSFPLHQVYEYEI